MGAALTPNETEVLALLRGANGPMTAYQLLGRMQRNGGAVAPPTVYRAVRRRMIWNIRGDFGAEVIGSSGSGYAALR